MTHTKEKMVLSQLISPSVTTQKISGNRRLIVGTVETAVETVVETVVVTKVQYPHGLDFRHFGPKSFLAVSYFW